MSHIIHLTADIRNVEILQPLISEEDKIYVEAIPDYFTDGPLSSEETQDVDAIRHLYRQSLTSQQVIPMDEAAEGPVKMAMRISSILSNDANFKVIYWMGANAIDVIGYFFMINYLKKHADKIQVINIAGLPFINEDFKLVFPNYIFQLPPNQLQKALKLARALSPSEIEIDGDEWKQLSIANHPVRILDGNKKIKGYDNTFFDAQIKSSLKDGAKMNRSVQHLFNKALLPISPLFIESRINAITSSTHMMADSDTNNTLNETTSNITE